ncbi:hypothetical protein F5Y15DRAFT_414894 [Xylariaceae sp. FL0016]|nr:hypothetical protein F5Y15DRAFT_414894 [Xylariaceae sp. FL0016]
MGSGFGFNLSTILMMVPMVVGEKDIPAAMASVTRIRVLGGTIGLAACSVILIHYIKSTAPGFLTQTQIAAILLSASNIATLSRDAQAHTRILFATGYPRQMRVMLYF